MLCSADILSDGIFDRAYNTYPVHEFTTTAPFSDELDEFFGVLADWVREAHGVEKAESR